MGAAQCGSCNNQQCRKDCGAGASQTIVAGVPDAADDPGGNLPDAGPDKKIGQTPQNTTPNGPASPSDGRSPDTEGKVHEKRLLANGATYEGLGTRSMVMEC